MLSANECLLHSLCLLSELSIQRKGKEKGQRKRNSKEMVCKGGGETDREGRTFSSSGCDISALLSDATKYRSNTEHSLLVTESKHHKNEKGNKQAGQMCEASSLNGESTVIPTATSSTCCGRVCANTTIHRSFECAPTILKCDCSAICMYGSDRCQQPHHQHHKDRERWLPFVGRRIRAKEQPLNEGRGGDQMRGATHFLCVMKLWLP